MAGNDLTREAWRLSTGAVLTAVVRDDVARLAENDPIVREGLDDEGVHQARVACRRLRSQLRSFSAALRHKEVVSVSGELKWIGGELGRVRDLDVLTARLARATKELGATGSGELLRRLRIERQEHYAHLIVTMNGRRYGRLAEALSEMAEEGAPVRASVFDEPAVEVLLPEVADRWHDLEREVARLGRGPRDDELHHVRILAKRARYAAEAAVGFGPGELGRLARRVAKVQKVLGELSDAFHTAAWLEGVKREPPGGGPASGGDPVVLIERLLAREHGCLAEIRATWRGTFERACDVAADLGWSDSPPLPRPGVEGEVVVRLQAVPFSP